MCLEVLLHFYGSCECGGWKRNSRETEPHCVTRMWELPCVSVAVSIVTEMCCCMNDCVSLVVLEWLCACMCACVRACAHVCVHTCVCVCAQVCACTRVCGGVHKCVWVHRFVCVYVHIYVLCKHECFLSEVLALQLCVFGSAVRCLLPTAWKRQLCVTSGLLWSS